MYVVMVNACIQFMNRRTHGPFPIYYVLVLIILHVLLGEIKLYSRKGCTITRDAKDTNDMETLFSVGVSSGSMAIPGWDFASALVSPATDVTYLSSIFVHIGNISMVVDSFPSLVYIVKASNLLSSGVVWVKEGVTHWIPHSTWRYVSGSSIHVIMVSLLSNSRDAICLRRAREVVAWFGFMSLNKALDRVHPKTSHFSTCHIILVNFKVVSRLYQPIFLSFSYLNSARHNLVM